MKKNITSKWLPTSSLVLAMVATAVAERGEQTITVTAESNAETKANQPANVQKRIVVKKIEGGDEKREKVELPFLGVSTEEPSEALAAQLGLRRGEGLLVSYVAPDGPAAKAGLEKNDVLCKLDDQILLLPTQLRKLVRLHKEGEKVELNYYRAGKKGSVSATLGKTLARAGLMGEDDAGSDEMQRLHFIMRDALSGSGSDNFKNLHAVTAANGANRQVMNYEIQREVENAKASIEKALRETSNSRRLAKGATKEIEEIVKSGVDVGKDASVTIRSQSREARTSVTTDDSGTYVIVATPKKRLTVHDKDGKLLFDGEIETDQEQDKVPRAIWEKVQPMLEKMKQAKTMQTDPELPAGTGTQSANEPEPEGPSNG